MRNDPVVSIGKGAWLDLVRDGTWEYVNRIRGTAVIAIIALTEADEIVLVEQYRPAFKACSIELPAGIVGDEIAFSDEGKLEAARRELEEETGFQASKWEFLYDGASSPGLATEICSVYRATGLSRVASGGGVEGENINVHAVSMRTVSGWLVNKQREGCVVDIKLWGALSKICDT
jgi:ADP-ribose pyrophosphatase